jgi:recombination protein RecT
MTEEKTQIAEVRGQLERMAPQFQMVLPPHVPVERFVRVVQTAVQNEPRLLECERKSLYAECMKAATDGLIPDGREAALTFFKDNKRGVTVAKYMPMIGGILKKVRNSGELASIGAHVIYEHDEFAYWVDEKGEHVKYTPLLFGERGKRIGAFAFATTKSDGFYFEPMTETQIMSVKAVSKARESGPWSGPFEDEMWRKTALRRLAKRLPMSTDAEAVIERDDELFDFENAKDVTPPKSNIRGVGAFMQVTDAQEGLGDEPGPLTGSGAEPTGEGACAPPAPANSQIPTVGDVRILMDKGDFDGAADLARSFPKAERAALEREIAAKAKKVSA